MRRRVRERYSKAAHARRPDLRIDEMPKAADYQRLQKVLQKAQVLLARDMRRALDNWGWLHNTTNDAAKRRALALEALRTCLDTALLTGDMWRIALIEMTEAMSLEEVDKFMTDGGGVGERVLDGVLAKSDWIQLSVPRWVAAEFRSLMDDYDSGKSLDKSVRADAEFRRKSRSSSRHGDLPYRIYQRFEQRVGEGEAINEHLFKSLAKEFGISSWFLCRKIVREEKQRREAQAMVEAEAWLDGSAVWKAILDLVQLAKRGQPITKELAKRVACEHGTSLPDIHSAIGPFCRRDVRADLWARKALSRLEQLQREGQISPEAIDRVTREHGVSLDDVYSARFWKGRLWE